jgi:hypothetical protein
VSKKRSEANMKYEDIKKANETIMTIDVKGKPYAEVNQRIKAFRMIYPQGFIETEMISNQDGVCVFQAIVGNDDKILGSGHAYEKENSTFINRTSYIENCETSAVGRALAMAGFGIDTSIASAEEVQNAITNQNIDKVFQLQDEMQKLMGELEEKDENFDREVVYNKYGNERNWTLKTYKEIIETLRIKLGVK